MEGATPKREIPKSKSISLMVKLCLLIGGIACIIGFSILAWKVQDCKVQECGLFEKCIGGKWCYQRNTKQQYTQCESSQDHGFTCLNPIIKYGSVAGGVPKKHGDNDYTEWCKQLCNGLAGSGITGSVTYGDRHLERSHGLLFWCDKFDESQVHHWCDWQDGHWHNESLDSRTSCNHECITSLTCRPATTTTATTTTSQGKPTH